MTFSVIGVTGLPCSGKSLAAELLAAGSIPGMPPGVLFKADDVGHAVLLRPDVVALLRERFGGETFLSDEPAAIRRAIAEKVFSNREDLAWLERVVHPRVTAETDRVIREEAGKRPVVVEAALLFAADMDARCERILLIESDFAVRLGRAAKRGWSREELQRREMRQVPLFAQACERDSAKRIVPVANNGTVGELETALAAVLSG